MRAATVDRRRSGRFRASCDGSVLPLVAVMIAAVLAAVALSVDFGAVFLARRRVQTAVDLAAIVAAQTIGDARRVAAQSLADNGVGAPGILTVETGRYVPDAATSAASRFQPGVGGPNAVRVRVTVAVPLYFGRVVLGRDTIDVSAAAVAAQANFASVSIGSRLVSLDAGLLNALLGAMLGTELGLSLVDYNALAAANLDAFAFTDAMASQIGVSAGRYNDILQLQANAGQVLTAASRAGGGGVGTAAASALRQIVAALPSSMPRFALDGLVTLGDPGGAPLGSHDPAHPSAARLLDLVSATAALANGSRQVQADLSVVAPSLEGARLTLSLGQPAQSAWVSTSAPGGTVATRQGRLLLESWMAAPLGLGRLYLPVYLDLASSRAVFQSIACPWSTPAQTSVALSVTTGVVTEAISAVVASAVDLGSSPPSLAGPATLLTAPLVSVTGRAVASVAGSSPQAVTFDNDDIARHRVRTVTATGLAASTVGSLVGGLSLNVGVVGFSLSPGSVSSAVAASLAAAAPAIDTLLDGVLRTLGIGLGQADVWINGVSCGRATLVQ